MRTIKVNDSSKLKSIQEVKAMTEKQYRNYCHEKTEKVSLLEMNTGLFRIEVVMDPLHWQYDVRYPEQRPERTGLFRGRAVNGDAPYEYELFTEMSFDDPELALKQATKDVISILLEDVKILAHWLSI